MHKTLIKYKKNGAGFFITGSYGVGKAHLAAAITNYLIQNLKAAAIFGKEKKRWYFIGKIIVNGW